MEIARVGYFDKVSFNQFKNDAIKLFVKDGKEYSDEYIKSIENMLEDAYKGIKLPERATAGSAGYDFFSPFSFKPTKGSGIEIPTGIRVNIQPGWVLKTYPRSGLGFKYGLREYNTVGIIDSDYFYSDNEGHIKIKVTVEEDCDIIDQGKGFCQGIFVPFGITNDDCVTARRNGGFGSTNK